MEFMATPNTKEGTLSLKGEITLLQAEQLKVLLARALDASEQVTIDTEAVTDIDLSCLQLICSAHRSALGCGRRWVLTPRRSEAFTEKVRQAGLTHCFACNYAPESDCLWKGGNL
jgi:anti-anti-sigma regulatory factor